MDHKPVRSCFLAEKIVIVDGQPGCGKTMLSPIISALERVELLSYLYEMEYICALKHLGRIEDDGAETMVRMLTDLKLYNTMMGRDVNFRPGDLSGAWRDTDPWRYFQRLFQKGDEAVPGRIKTQRPILNLTTHNLVPFSGPVLKALEERVTILEVVRHPLYMVKQQSLNMERLLDDPRYFTIHFEHNGRQLPFWAKGWEDLFLRGNALEKTIYAIDRLTTLARKTKEQMSEAHRKRIMMIPFESFVLDPWAYMNAIAQALDTRVTALTKRMMKKQKVPRARTADGPALNIYKRCGWQPAQSTTEEEELKLRRDFVAGGVSREALAVLDRLCVDHEEQYMGGKKRIPGRNG
jgi:hypothetical protein